FPLLFLAPPPTTPLYPLSLHDALPISRRRRGSSLRPRHHAGAAAGAASPDLRDRHGAARDPRRVRRFAGRHLPAGRRGDRAALRSEEHTSELQSRENLVCRLLLEKKNK